MRFTGKTSLVAMAMFAMALFATACAAAAENQPDATTPQPKLAPVSWRLKGKLTHSSREKQPAAAADIRIVGVRFSPDGKQLLACDESADSALDLWDVEMQKRIRTIKPEVGHLDYAAFGVSHDWKTVLTPICQPLGKFETIKRGDKTFIRQSFDDFISVWNLQSGELVKKLHPDTMRRIRFLYLSRDRVHCICSEELSGEFVQGRRDDERLSIWNRERGEHRTLPKEVRHAVYSSRGNFLAASIRSPEMPSLDQGIDIIENLDDPKSRRLVSYGPFTIGWPMAFLAGDSLLVGFLTVDTSPPNHSIVFWNTKTGEEDFRVENVLPTVAWACRISPDDRTAYALCYQASGMKSLFLIDSKTRDVRKTELGDNAVCQMAAFHPNGKWIAAPVLSIPAGHNKEENSNTLPQPKILIIEVATGKVLETLTSPQCHPDCCVFSPDGKTLATSGNGEVLLWDFSVPPGNPPGN